MEKIYIWMTNNVTRRWRNNRIEYKPKDGRGSYFITLFVSMAGKYIPANSRWKLCGEKVIKGEKHYKLGTDKQYAPAKFFKVVK